MFTLYDVRADVGRGREMFGEDYTDVWAINDLHFAAGSTLEGDYVSSENPSYSQQMVQYSHMLYIFLYMELLLNILTVSISREICCTFTVLAVLFSPPGLVAHRQDILVVRNNMP